MLANGPAQAGGSIYWQKWSDRLKKGILRALDLGVGRTDGEEGESRERQIDQLAKMT